MSIEHLSEKRIQQYLDNKCTGLEAGEVTHLETCDRCQGVMEEYEQVYAMLGQEPRESLSAEFASRTMDRIMGASEAAAGWSRWNLLWAAVGALSCLIAIWYTIDLKALLNKLTAISIQQMVGNSPFVSSLRDANGRLGEIVPIVIFAVLVLAAVGLADRLFLRQKATRAYFISV